VSKLHAQLSDLPPHLQAQAKAQMPDLYPTKPTVILDAPKHKGPNKTEAHYRRAYIDTRYDVKSVHYEGLTLRMANGHKYTPDYVVVTNDGVIELHEVKGSYKLGSYGRAKLAFDQAKVEFPCFKFVWWTKGGMQ